MPKCAVKKCTSNTLSSLKKDGKSYFRFPKNELDREKWRRIICKERDEEYYKPNKSSVVCSNHFREGDMYNTKCGLRKLKKGTIPRIGVEPWIPIPATLSSKPSTEVAPAAEVTQATEILLVKREPKTSASSERSEPENRDVHPMLQIISVKTGPPSPTSSGNSSIFDSPEVHYYKKTLRTYEEKIISRTKQIQNLNKKVLRLNRANERLREVVTGLRKQHRKDKLLIAKLSVNADETSCGKVMDIEGVFLSERRDVITSNTKGAM